MLEYCDAVLVVDVRKQYFRFDLHISFMQIPTEQCKIKKDWKGKKY